MLNHPIAIIIVATLQYFQGEQIFYGSILWLKKIVKPAKTH